MAQRRPRAAPSGTHRGNSGWLSGAVAQRTEPAGTARGACRTYCGRGKAQIRALAEHGGCRRNLGEWLGGLRGGRQRLVRAAARPAQALGGRAWRASLRRVSRCHAARDGRAPTALLERIRRTSRRGSSQARALRRPVHRGHPRTLLWIGNLNPNRGAEVGKIRPVLLTAEIGLPYVSHLVAFYTQA